MEKIHRDIVRFEWDIMRYNQTQVESVHGDKMRFG